MNLKKRIEKIKRNIKITTATAAPAPIFERAKACSYTLTVNVLVPAFPPVRRKIPSLLFFLYPLIREQTKPTVEPDKKVNEKLGMNASPVEKDDITLKHHTIVIAHRADNNGATIYPFRIDLINLLPGL